MLRGSMRKQMITPKRGENFINRRSETNGIFERAVVRIKEETSGMKEDEAQDKGWKNKIEEILSHEIAGQYTEQKVKGSSETAQHEGS